MNLRTVSASRLRELAAATLDRVLAGEGALIQRHGRPVAVLLPARWSRRCERCALVWVSECGSPCPRCGAAEAEVLQLY